MDKYFSLNELLLEYSLKTDQRTQSLLGWDVYDAFKNKHDVKRIRRRKEDGFGHRFAVNFYPNSYKPEALEIVIKFQQEKGGIRRLRRRIKKMQPK
jgi:hypothetical protein